MSDEWEDDRTDAERMRDEFRWTLEITRFAAAVEQGNFELARSLARKYDWETDNTHDILYGILQGEISSQEYHFFPDVLKFWDRTTEEK